MAETVVLSTDDKLAPERFRERFAAAGFDDVDVERAEMDTTEKLVDGARDADAIVTNVTADVGAEEMDALSDLQCICRAAVGLDGIDVDAAAERGIPVVHVPDYCLDEVATHALSLLLSLARGLPSYAVRAANDDWDWEPSYPIRRLPGSTVGLVSFGPIARRFAHRAAGLDVDVVAYDPYVDAETMADHGVEKVDFAGLCNRADHLSVHAPLTDETAGLVDGEVFETLPEHAVVVNTGRGGVVDESDLVAALDAGDVAAAGLDVLASEPAADHPLYGRDDAVVTPHVAWYSAEAVDDVNVELADDIAQVFRGDEPDGAVDPDADWL